MRFLVGLFVICLCGCQCGKWGCPSPCGPCGKSVPGLNGELVCCEGNAHHWRWIDKTKTKSNARKLAARELKKLQRSCITCDFRYGYEQAFVDIALGACGDVPPLPPALYWKEENRTAFGHQRAQEWFAGYAAGSSRAKHFYEPYNEVAAIASLDGDCP
ncbi:MAG: hypothetical protein KDA80_04930 [Planctomycetaceae bacterium]|nr:hypothetical protein [Planctomycetaceae bacterium]